MILGTGILVLTGVPLAKLRVFYMSISGRKYKNRKKATTMKPNFKLLPPPLTSKNVGPGELNLNLQLHATTNISNPGAFGIIGDTTFTAEEYNAGIVESDLSQNGYAKFANGLIIQWGYSSGGEVTFPIQFPNRVLNVVVSPLVNNDGIGGNCWYVTTLTTTKFDTACSVARRWIAIGI